APRKAARSARWPHTLTGTRARRRSQRAPVRPITPRFGRLDGCVALSQRPPREASPLEYDLRVNAKQCRSPQHNVRQPARGEAANLSFDPVDPRWFEGIFRQVSEDSLVVVRVWQAGAGGRWVSDPPDGGSVRPSLARLACAPSLHGVGQLPSPAPRPPD